MAAEPLNPTERYSALDGLEVVYVPVVAAGTYIPTRAEIDAGTDLSSEIEGGLDTWDIEPSSIRTPSLRRVIGSLPGSIELPEPELRIYADRGSDDVADVLPDGTKGFIVIFPTGDRTGARMNSWPVRVNRLSELHSTEAASMYRVKFNVLDLPAERIAVPATV